MMAKADKVNRADFVSQEKALWRPGLWFGVRLSDDWVVVQFELFSVQQIKDQIKNNDQWDYYTE
jgi:hypothetical protein